MNKQFWDQLLVTTSAIEAIADTEVDRLAKVHEQLESIENVYHRTFDPTDAYEEYVAVSLCRAINQALPGSQQ